MNKILTTNERGPRFQEVAPDRATPGPMMGVEISPLQFIGSNATEAEIQVFKKTIRDRMAKEPREIFEVCMKCGYVSTRGPRRKAGRSCFKCNFHGEVGGGTCRDMIPAEVKAYQAREAKKDAEWRARAERAEFNYDCEDRKKHGLIPLTLEEFRARQKAEWKKRRAEDRELLDLARKLTKDLPR